MIKPRIDVDYPYPSRAKSFLSIILKSKVGKDYLKNPKIIVKMINKSPVEAKARAYLLGSLLKLSSSINLSGLLRQNCILERYSKMFC